MKLRLPMTCRRSPKIIWIKSFMLAYLSTANSCISQIRSLEWMSPQGDQIEINIAYDSEDALRIAFDKLAAGGTVKMPVDTMFWNAVYGSLVDKFGIGWSLDYELPKE